IQRTFQLSYVITQHASNTIIDLAKGTYAAHVIFRKREKDDGIVLAKIDREIRLETWIVEQKRAKPCVGQVSKRSIWGPKKCYHSVDVPDGLIQQSLVTRGLVPGKQ